MTQAIACILSMFGSLALAYNKRFGWLLFLAANLFWIAFAIAAKAYWLALQNVVFIITSGLGCYNSYFKKGVK